MITATLCLFIQHSKSVAQVAPIEERYPFVVVTDDSLMLDLGLSDEEFYDRSRGIIFQVNKTDIGPQDAFVRLYEDSIVPIINERHLQLRKVYIRGAASPEGPYDNNRRLGQGRSQALLDVLRRHLFFQEGNLDVDVKSVTEDYGYLCLLMERANDPDFALVRNIYNNVKGDELQCKRELQRAQGGRLWKRLLRQYFPRLRAARFVLWFHDPHYEEPSVMESVIQQMTPTIDVSMLDSVAKAVIDTVPPAPDTIYYTRRHLIALRTNLVADLWYQPQYGFAPAWNIQAEYYPLRGHYTYNLSFTYPYWHKWSQQKFFQIRDYRASVRRYFKGGGRFIGWFANAYIENVKYGIGFNDHKGWQGEGFGGGLGLGYVTKLNQKGNWRLEFILEAGYLNTKYDPYVYGNPVTGKVDDLYYYNWHGNASDFKRRNHRFTWLGPTMVGVQLTYDVIYRKKQRVN